MLLKWHRPLDLGWLSCYMILVSFLLSSHMPTAHGQDDDFKDEPGLTKHYELLYEFYKAKMGTIKSDCKLSADKSNAEDIHHEHWGTIETLEFLTGNRQAISLSLAEKRMKLPKLRQFLARVGFLKEPGSLVFLDKQGLTMRLAGCRGSAAWRQQGEAGDDKKIQNKYPTGDKFKEQAPNANNYIHKFTCFSTGTDKCTHVFYVITKMLPELPLGLLVKEDKKSNEYDFACTVPYCRVKNCAKTGEATSIPRRSYPPFKIYWHIPATLSMLFDPRPTDDTLNRTHYESVTTNATSPNKALSYFNFKWDYNLRASKDADYTLSGSYKEALESNFYDFKDGFGAIMKPGEDKDLYALQSRMQISLGDEDTQIGEYECIIEDANGVVTTPNHYTEEYRGKAHIHIIYNELYYSYAVALGCIIVTGIIIAICPRKMEHDDGTPYTKDELVSPDAKNDEFDTTSPQPTQEASKSSVEPNSKIDVIHSEDISVKGSTKAIE